MSSLSKYLLTVLVALDQVANALLWGDADETLSARAFRNAKLTDDPKLRWVLAHRLINSLFFWQSGHCFQAYASEVDRRHLPKHYQR